VSTELNLFELTSLVTPS